MNTYTLHGTKAISGKYTWVCMRARVFLDRTGRGVPPHAKKLSNFAFRERAYWNKWILVTYSSDGFLNSPSVPVLNWTQQTRALVYTHASMRCTIKCTIYCRTRLSIPRRTLFTRSATLVVKAAIFGTTTRRKIRPTSVRLQLGTTMDQKRVC